MTVRGLSDRPSWNHKVSNLAGRLLEEGMQVLEVAPTKFRSTIFQRSLFVRGFQRWCLDLGIKMRATLVRALWSSVISTGEWLQSPQTVAWRFDMSRKGVTSRKVESCTGCAPKDVCPLP